MATIRNISLADLLVDSANARLAQEQPSQQEALLAVAMEQKSKLLQLATGIRKHGLDPLKPMAVRPAGGGKYVVVEGNRRLTAMKALESPGIVEPAFSAAQQRRLRDLAASTQPVPIEPVPCVVFETEDEFVALDHWVTLLHTGANDGEGVVEWRAEEKDRHLSRRGGGSYGGQILEIVRAATGEDYRNQGIRNGFITTLTRLVSTPEVRDRLGLDVRDNKIVSWHKPEDIVGGLTRIVEDLAAGKENSRTLHKKEARESYIKRLPKKLLPPRSSRLNAPIPLAAPNLAATARRGASGGSSAGAGRKVREAPRKYLIPKTCHLNIVKAPRIKLLYTELHSVLLEEARNLCAVGLRVFTELSVDHLIEGHRLMKETERRNAPLAKRIKVAATYLETSRQMPAQLKDAIASFADGKHNALGASTVTWNQYVHNKYHYPNVSQLRDTWDELQPFFEHLWP